MESKSFKLYLWPRRDEGVFHEHLVSKILDDLGIALDPRWSRVPGAFCTSVGIAITVAAEHVQRPGNVAGARFFLVLVALFATSLVVSNAMPVELVHRFGLPLPAAMIPYPVTYIFGDGLSQVLRIRPCASGDLDRLWLQPGGCSSFGDRRLASGGPVVWRCVCDAGWRPTSLPGHSGVAPRPIGAPFVAYLAGEFLNSVAMARLKVAASGLFLWVGTISSTLLGEGVESAMLISVACLCVIQWEDLGLTILSQWLYQSANETLAIPLANPVVDRLKREEGLDSVNWETIFDPLRF